MNTNTSTINGLDPGALAEEVATVTADPASGRLHFDVGTQWRGGFHSTSRTRTLSAGGETIERAHRIEADEPTELLGTNQGSNPQELALAALNACLAVGFVSGCTAEGIELESLEIRTQCDIDLRGFFAIDPSVPAGAPTWKTQIVPRGDGSPEQFAAILEHVKRTSPNFFHAVHALSVDATLECD